MTDRDAMKLALEALDQYIEKELTFGQRYTNEGQQLLDAHAILRQALEQPEQVNVPEGWKLVPIEPTDAMLSVPVNIDLRECVTPGGVTGLDAVGLFNAWEAMIEAAPHPWDATDMAHRTGGLSMEQDEIVPSYYSGVTGDYSGVTGDYMEPPSWTPVEIGVDVTPEGTHVVGMYVLMPQAVRHVFYSQFHPAPKREWVGLTDEEIQKVAHDMGTIGDLSHDEFDICRAVIAKLKEKNT